MSKKEKLKTFDELWEELKNDKEYGEQFRFIDRVVNQDKENERLKQRLEELQEKYDACQEARKLEAEFKNQEFMDHSQELVDMEKQLAEKDKEIEKVENYYKSREKNIVKDADEIIKKLEKQLAEKDKEINELEQEREFMLDEVKNRGTCGLCEKLENKEINELRKQLEEKDKKIEEMTQTIVYLYNTNINLEMYSKQVRKQVCDEIKEKLKVHCDWANGNFTGWYIPETKIATLIDQIEKGTNKDE